MEEENIKKQLKVSISTPRGVLFEGEVDFLLAPGKEGLLGVLPGHTKLISLLREGDIVLKKHEEEDKTIHVKDGILQINRENVEFLCTQ